jgi:PAS domain S-box-containing protein
MAASNAWLVALGVAMTAFLVAIAGVGAAISRERRWVERQRSQAALARTQERLRLAQESSGIGLFDVDLRSGRIEHEGPRPPLVGERPETLDDWIAAVHPDDTPRVREALGAHLEGRTSRYECDLRLPGRDGGWRWVRARGTVVQRGPGGAPLRFIGTFEDITERRDLEAELRQAQKMEAIGGMAGGLAHDFNNLLTAISGHTEIGLLRLAEGDPVRENLEEVRRAAQRAAGLTGQLLAFSRKQVLQPRVIELNAIVAETQRMIRRLIGEHIVVETDLDPTTGRIRADATQIVQVLLNLAVNARDAMPEGGTLRIRTTNVDVGAEQARDRVGMAAGTHVALEVSDTGTGMTPDVQAHIFEPFFTTKGPGHGTGLGLSTVYGVVSQSGGSIAVAETRPGAGTTFRVLLPRVDAPAEPLDERALVQDASGRGEVVLLVEDDDLVRGLVEKALATRGYRVVSAAGPDAALALAEQLNGPADLLLTDVVMPGLNGRELAQRLAARWPGLRVLYMSGYTAGSMVTRGILEPGLAFLPKPFRPDELGGRVREVLDAPAGTYRY